jgi:hypothetical protein
LTSLHVGKNGIPEKEMREIMAIATIAMHMDSMKVLCEVPFKDKTLTELDITVGRIWAWRELLLSRNISTGH